MFPEYHPLLAVLYDLELAEDDNNSTIMTSDKIKRLYRDAKGKMNQSIANWRKSGNGAGNLKKNKARMQTL